MRHPVATGLTLFATVAIVGWILVRERGVTIPRDRVEPEKAGRQTTEAAAGAGFAAAKITTNAVALPVISPRAPRLDRSRLDLGAFYNTGLADSLGVNEGNSLARLPTGPQQLNGTVEFDIRGMIQLMGDEFAKARHEIAVESVIGIPVRQKTSRVHFLHGASVWGGSPAKDGFEIGSYVVHYSDGTMLKFPIVYGQHVRNWWCCLAGEAREASEALIAWEGDNAVTEVKGKRLRLFHATYINPRPEVVIETIDFVSAKTPCTPILLSITLEK